MIVKHFKDNENNIFGIDIYDESNEDWKLEVKEGWVEITIEEARAIVNPPPTQQEIDQQKSAENIAFLSSETRRTNDAIAILDDAIEFEIETDEEIAQHKELRKYRIELMRVKEQEGYPLHADFPTCPDFFSE